jgi:hypothetical protein
MIPHLIAVEIELAAVLAALCCIAFLLAIPLLKKGS